MFNWWDNAVTWGDWVIVTMISSFITGLIKGFRK